MTSPRIAADDTSFDAFRDGMERRYDAMPAWWWLPGAQERTYRKWKAGKEREIADIRSTNAAVKGARRVLDIIAPREPGD